ncbi:MAG: GxxExxY protein [Verrucomicrobiota bacterium]|nr:GxxExxY protein [Verrucomicrobiota bacterium]
MPQDNKQLCKDEVYSIVGCAIDVLNSVGAGLPEAAYENALAIELKERGIPFEQNKDFELKYKEQLIGQLETKLVVFDQVIVDFRVEDRINHHDRNQLINQLKISELEVGIILNFKRPKLEWERFVFTRRPPDSENEESEEELNEIYDVENDDSI